jgi:tetratricopeptide (TPR) repeat protein
MQVVRLDPADPKPRWLRGDTLFRSGEYARALVDYDKAIRLDSTSHDYFYSRAIVHTYLYQCDNAIAVLTEAIQLSQESPVTASYYYRDRAKIHRARGDYGKAEADLANVHELFPELFASLSQDLE